MSFIQNIIIFYIIYTKIRSKKVIRCRNRLILLRNEALTFTTHGWCRTAPETTPASMLDVFRSTNTQGVFRFSLKRKQSIFQGHGVPGPWLHLSPYSENRGVDMDPNWFIHTNAMHSMREANNWILLKLCPADWAVSVISSLWHFANCSD